jgi:acyl carrier protein
METKQRPTVLEKDASTKRFVAIICEVLGVESVSTDQHFLDAGGDSLSIAIIIDWVAQEFSVEPELDWFFESESIDMVTQRWWAKVEEAA